MRRIYHLSTCDTCRKILSTLDLSDVELINIREQNISKEDLDFMKKQTKSYEALFNKRAQKLKEMPDSLLVLQSMAFDTLRAIQEKQLLKPKGISIGLN